jgi:outer membrane protein
MPLRLLLAAAALFATAGSPVHAQTMTDTLSRAYLFSPDLKAARYALDAVNEDRPRALSGWLPTVTVAGGPSRTLTTAAGTSPLRTNTASGQVVLTVPVTSGGGEYAALRQAEHAIRAQRALLLSTEQVVLGEAAQAHLDVWLAARVVGFWLDNVAALRQATNSIEREMRAGDRTLVDLTLSRVRAATAEASLAQSRGSLEQARLSYRQYVGAPPGQPDLPPVLSVLPPDQAAAQALAAEQGPSVVAARFQARAARDNVDVQLAKLLPALSLQAVAQQGLTDTQEYPSYLKGKFTSRSLTLQLTVPLYQGGAEYASVRQAAKTARQNEETLRSAREAAVAAAGRAWQQRAATEDARKAYATGVRENRKLVDEYQVQLDAGQLTVLEILDGYQSLVTAQIAAATAEHDRILADFAVLNAMGGMTARTLALPVPYYDPDGDYRRSKWRIFGLATD